MAQRIYIDGNQFKVDGKPIYLNGCNTPWNKWNDFGGKYDSLFWENEFKRLHENGMNSVRVWISCDGEVQPYIDSTGFVTGVSDKFWKDVDHLIKTAEANQLYLMATMLSFDHVKITHENNNVWRQMLNDSSKVRSYILNYLLPFVKRYENNPYLFSIDLCNEIEWMQEKEECGNFKWNILQRYVAMCAASIHHSGSKVLVTMGSAGVKWNSDKAIANFWSDMNLQKQFSDKAAFLDFWQFHYYSWINPYFGNPFSKSPADYNINDRPVVVGEMPAKESGLPSGLTMFQAFNELLNNGYSGHFPWTSNGLDKEGNLNDFGDSALNFKTKHSLLVNPGK